MIHGNYRGATEMLEMSYRGFTDVLEELYRGMAGESQRYKCVEGGGTGFFRKCY